MDFSKYPKKLDNSNQSSVSSTPKTGMDFSKYPKKNKIENPESLFQRVIKNIGQGMEASATGTVPNQFVMENPEYKSARDENIGMNMQMVNGALAGIPSAVASMTNQNYPESSSPFMNAVMSIGGGIGGAPGKISGAVADPIKNVLVRGAARGGVFGGLMPGSLVERAKNIGIGIVTGAPAEFAGEVISKTPNFVGNVIKKGKELFDSGGKLKQVESQLSGLESRELALRSAKDTAGKSLKKEAISASKNAKTKIKKTASNWTDTYGQTLDDAESILEESGKKISKSDYKKNVIDKSISEAENMRLPSDNKTLSKLREIKSSLEPENVGPIIEESPILDEYGKNITRTIEPPAPDDSFLINNFRDIKDKVFGKISTGSKKGISYNKPEDVAGRIFLKNHNEYLASNVDEIASVNKEFTPAVRSRNWGYKTFKPNSPEEVQKGASVLERIAKGTHNQDDLNFLNNLEKGSGRFKGTGSLRGNTTSLGDQLKLIDDQIKEISNSKSNLLQQKSIIQDLVRQRNQLIIRAGQALGVTGAGGFALKKYLGD